MGGDSVTTTQPTGQHTESTRLATDPTDGDTGESGRRRLPKIGPVLPARLRPVTRPKNMLVEIALIGISYFCYRVTQNAARAGRNAPYNRGWDILRLERTLHINFELWLNHTVDKVNWLIVGMNYYYGTLHFIVPVAVLVWVYFKFPDHYRAVRTVLFATTGLALIGFYFYALAPPRLLPGAGFIDTFCIHGTWGQKPPAGGVCTSVAGLTGVVSNNLAAMPSVHIGWSAWCGLTIASLARRKWVKALGILYPTATFIVIISSANHYVLDAVGGLVTLAAGFLVQRILHGRSVYGPLPAVAAGPGEIPEIPRQGTAPDGSIASSSAPLSQP
jgi:PAP2 superfamily